MITPKQARFVEEYLVDLNATQAAVRAGYSPKTARVQASDLLMKPDIQDAVAAAKAARSERVAKTAADVVEELVWLGFANVLDYTRITDEGEAYVDLSAVTRGQGAAIQEITVEEFKDGRGKEARDVRRTKFKLADKKGALVALLDHLSPKKSRLEVTGPDGGPLETFDLSKALERLSPEKRAALREILQDAVKS